VSLRIPDSLSCSTGVPLSCYRNIPFGRSWNCQGAAGCLPYFQLFAARLPRWRRYVSWQQK